MTEIPEHLLKRSRERRAALGLGGDAAPSEGGGASEAPASDAAPAAATPAPAATPATPAPVEEPKPEPPKPVPAYVQAAYKRRRVPYWAMPVLAALPLWGYAFYATLEPAPLENDPLTLGEELYSSVGCAGCHGPGGDGQGATPGFENVTDTWPDPRDHMMWVRLGASGWPGTMYGENNVRNEPLSAMPANESLSDEELAQIVLYERRVLGNEEAPPPEEDVLMQIALGELTFQEAELGPASQAAGIPEDDLEPGG